MVAKQNSSQREFETTDVAGNKVKLVCVRPNQHIIDGAKLEYNIKYAEALRAGCLCRIEVEKIIEDRKLWSDDHEKKLQLMRRDLAAKESELKHTKDLKRGEELAREMSEARTLMIKFISVHNEILNRTCESFAESAQNQYLLTRCVLRPDDHQSYFESYESFKSQENSQLIADALMELRLFLADLTQADLVNNTVEAKWLVKKDLIDAETGFFKRDGKLFDDKGRCVTKEGRFISPDTGEFIDEFGFPLTNEDKIEGVNTSIGESEKTA